MHVPNSNVTYNYRVLDTRPMDGPGVLVDAVRGHPADDVVLAGKVGILQTYKPESNLP